MTDERSAGHAIQMVDITKTFGGVRALEHVDFDLLPGEVHALVGENGAGKSTLLKVLLGVHPRDGGEIRIFGQPMPAHYSPLAARARGVAMIFQELSLIPTLTVAENVFLAREPRSGMFLDDAQAREQTRALLADLGVALDADARASSLSTGERQLVEITKALSQDARVLIMDEPTSALTTAETALLFGLLDRLRQRGVAIVYVSHRMDEIFRVADRISVLRDGQRVVTSSLEELGVDGVIAAIVGRRVAAFERQPSVVRQDAETVLLSVQDLRVDPRPSGVTFDLRAGEILGFAGLMGSGRSELARALVGLQRVVAGEVHLRGERVVIDSPREGMAKGIAMLPEDRVEQGLVLDHSVAGNMSLPILRRLTRRSLIDDNGLRNRVGDLVSSLRIKTRGIEEPVRRLSGGNQQKVVLAKWLASEPDVLVLDEPTAGIDIGSKAEIIAHVRALASRGNGIIVISSELPELLALSDRIIVLDSGEVIREIDSGEIDGWMAAGAGPEEQLAIAERRLQRAIQRV